jgi:ABC-type multidrug transport system fused ATPase/permease subunit
MRAALRRLMRVNIIWQSGWLSFQKLMSLIRLPMEVQPKEQEGEPMPETPAETTGTRQDEIQIEGLGFSYQDDRQLFTGISIRLTPGTITLLKGPQGTGKTTFIKLLLRLFAPTQGTILLNGVDYKDLTPFGIRKKIAVVSEDMPLLGNTIFEAIAYRPTPERRERAAKILDQLGLSFAADSNAALAYGLSSGASNISAGDRAMLQVARALMTRKKILLLDEPFKQLDTAHKQILLKHLQKLKPTHTILLVANNIPAEINIDQTIDLQHLIR